MSKTVLIVEDNELNMKLFKDLLEAHDISTVETSDGRNVLDLAREHKPDLILMDIQLPEVSGLQRLGCRPAKTGLLAPPARSNCPIDQALFAGCLDLASIWHRSGWQKTKR